MKWGTCSIRKRTCICVTALTNKPVGGATSKSSDLICSKLQWAGLYPLWVLPVVPLPKNPKSKRWMCASSMSIRYTLKLKKRWTSQGTTISNGEHVSVPPCRGSRDSKLPDLRCLTTECCRVKSWPRVQRVSWCWTLSSFRAEGHKSKIENSVLKNHLKYK